MDSDKELKPSQPAVEDSEEEENEILEESPCGRWLKRREEVEQSNIPGIDATYLAMDTEEGVEVVWNEVRFSERKYFKAKEEIISEVFDRLIQLEHPNIVKLHKYWIHKDAEMPRVIFITEYMSSGSLKQFLRKTKRHDIKMALQAWRRWCTQTLSALCYLHSSQPPIIHGNINCDTIFISYNGLIKIGAIAPDAIHRHVKTVRADSKSNLHFIAPELGNDQDSPVLSPAVDIYSFGMCALEMAALEISNDDDDASHHISDDVIQKTIDSLENPLQKDFIQRCLCADPHNRPSARDLLFHPIIFEVPTLRLFCAHSILNNPSLQPEQLTEDAIFGRFLGGLQNHCDRTVAEIRYAAADKPPRVFKQSDFPNRELEKFLDEVRNGACPLTAIITTTRPPLMSKQRTISPEVIDDAHKLINTPDNPYDEETRRIVHINCSVQPIANDATNFSFDVKIVIKLDDKINRQLTSEIINDQFIPSTIAQELVYFGFINKDDKEIVAGVLFETFSESQLHPNHVTCCEKSFEIQKSYITPPGNIVFAPPQTQQPQPTILVSPASENVPSDTFLQPIQSEPEDLSLSSGGNAPQSSPALDQQHPHPHHHHHHHQHHHHREHDDQINDQHQSIDTANVETHHHPASMTNQAGQPFPAPPPAAYQSNIDDPAQSLAFQQQQQPQHSQSYNYLPPSGGAEDFRYTQEQTGNHIAMIMPNNDAQQPQEQQQQPQQQQLPQCADMAMNQVNESMPSMTNVHLMETINHHERPNS